MKFVQLLKMDLRNIFSNPAWFIMQSVFPLAMALILSLIMNPYYGDSVRAIDYFSVTGLVFMAANSAVMAANTFLEERIKKANLRVVYAPVSKFSVTFSKVLSTFFFVSFWELVLGIIYITIFKVNLLSLNFWILMLSLCFTASALGVMIASVFKSEETANMISSTIISLLAVLGGSFFAIPKFLQKISNLSFIKWVNEAAFKVLYNDSSSIIMVVLSLFVVTLGCLFLTQCVFKEENYL